MGKPIQPHQPGVYRDDPDRDDAASTSSAVLLGDIDYPDEELPSYTDEPNGAEVPIPSGQFPAAHIVPGNSWYLYDSLCSEEDIITDSRAGLHLHSPSQLTMSTAPRFAPVSQTTPPTLKPCMT